MDPYQNNFRECYEKYMVPLTRFVSKRIGKWDAAQDIVQDIFTYLYERKIHLDIRSHSLKGYLYQIATHRIIDYLRNARSSEVICGNLDEVILDTSTLTKIEDCVCEGEVISTMNNIVEMLEEPHREIVFRSMYHGHKAKKISREMEISQYRVHRALKEFTLLVREKIAPYYFYGFMIAASFGDCSSLFQLT